MTNRETLNESFTQISNVDLAKFFEHTDDGCEMCVYKFESDDCLRNNCFQGIMSWLEQEEDE